MTVYSPAPSVKAIAERLIPLYHADLVDVRIEYVFRDNNATSAGKEMWGKARKVSGLNAYLATEDTAFEHGPGDDDFFVVEIAKNIWQLLTHVQQEALVDHELCHLSIDYNDVKLVIRSHDVEEFGAVIQRHGLWRVDVKQFVDAANQLTFDFDNDTSVRLELNGEPVDPSLNILKDGHGVLRAVAD